MFSLIWGMEKDETRKQKVLDNDKIVLPITKLITNKGGEVN